MVVSKRLSLGIGSGLAVALAVALLAPSALRAQEATPTATAGEQPPATDTVLRVEAPEGPFAEGDQFDVQLVIENVDHLASIDAYIGYDSSQLRLVSGQMEPFFLDGEREAQCGESPNGWVVLSGSTSQIETALGEIQGVVTQPDDEGGTVTAWFPASETDKALEAGDVEETRVLVNCVSVGPPLSQGGSPGVSGSGTLATVTFEAIGGGTAQLQLTDTALVLDDLDANDAVQTIPHETQSASVELEGDGGDGGSSWLVIAVAAGVAVALVFVGGLVLLRRGRGGPPPGPDSPIQA
jgi:hypothetical protein